MVRVIHDTGGLFSQGDVTDRPCPAITIGVKGLNSSHYLIETGGGRLTAQRPDSGKPPYRVPSMVEIAALPWNGYTVASTFSGGGGSSCGYSMAGYRVAWASEFVPAAQDTYRANFPITILDGRDVRKVSGADILKALKIKVGELDVFDGSPPCQSFSTAGKREAGWGKVRDHGDHKQIEDDLFFEYARLVGEVQPRIFIAENVSGLVKGTAKGYFKEILAALKAAGPGYTVEARLLDAQWLGVPQMRQRIIFIGVRSDLVGKYGVRPLFPKPLPYRYSVREALPWIVKVATANDHYVQASTVQASTVQASTGRRTSSTLKGEPLGMVEAEMPGRIIHDESGAWSKGDISARPSPSVRAQRAGMLHIEPEAYLDHTAIGKEWDKLKEGEQSDRYFSLTRPDSAPPSPAVTRIGGGKGVAGVTHPTERRKFTIAELRRICAFPDDFILTGTYAQQWERCGNAVPPVMMCAIATAVRPILDTISASSKRKNRA